MIAFIITRIFWLASVILKEFGLFVGLAEQMIKMLAGIASFTPTREDDILIQQVEDLFDSWQKKIYNLATNVVNFYNKIWIKLQK